MSVLAVLTAFAASLAGALLLVPVVRQLAHRIGWVDAPDGERKVHPEAVPNVGGLGIIGGVLLGLGAVIGLGAFGLVSLDGLLPSSRWLIGGLLIASVGFIDDRVDLNHWTRLIAQLGVAALVFSDGARIDLLDGLLGGGALALAASFLLTAIWMVGMMNAVNLIDGLDGLAGGSVAIAFVGLAGVHAVAGGMPSFVLVAVFLGALVGFLRYNCCPASIFMGDSGSLFLGYSLAAYALYGTAHVNPVLNLVVPAVVMGLPVLDTSVSILRRILTQRPLFAPDKDHIHHRLADRMRPAAAVRVLWGLSLFLALGGLAMSALPPFGAGLVFVVGTLVVYDLLWRVGYLPSLKAVVVLLRRRRRLEDLRSERMRRVNPDAAPDLPPRAGRVAERYHPLSGPER